MCTANYLSLIPVLRNGIAAIVMAGVLVPSFGCTSSHDLGDIPSAGQPAAEPRSEDQVADDRPVDCLLPARVRRLAPRLTYLAPRRPVRTSAGNCAIRGGDYVPPDRADYRTALKVWLSAAEEGDAVAQTRVGEILEEGLGTPPDPGTAAQWYRRAAEQGYEAAQAKLAKLRATHGLALAFDDDPEMLGHPSALPGRGAEGIAELGTAPRTSDEALLYFAHGDARLSPAATRILDELVTRFDQAPGVSVVLNGHADKSGTEAYNLQLSQRRADAVREYLVSHGLPTAAVTTVGLGDTEPMIETSGDRAENRRVELLFRSEAMRDSRLKILGTVYDFLTDIGDEPQGYGLYTYILFPYYSDRVPVFLNEVTKTTLHAGDSKAASTPARASRPRTAELNLMLIPVRQSVSKALLDKKGKWEQDEIRDLAENAYDYPFAQEVTFAICRDPYPLAVDFCDKARGRGPYLMTYTEPITGLESIQPPYLIADFSDFHDEALLLLLNAYKEQVKRPNYVDRERLELLRLRV